MPYNTTPLVLHSGVRPTWLPGRRRPVLVSDHDRKGRRGRARRSGQGDAVGVRPAGLPGGRARPDASARRRPATTCCRRTAGGGRSSATGISGSATSRRGRETQLTTDGVKDFGYATDNAGWTRSDRPILLWSPDSKKIATFQQDQRDVGEMYLVDTRRRPSDAAGVEVSAAGRRDRHDDPARRHRRRRAARWSACRCRPISIARRSATTWPAAGEWGDVQWAADGSTVAFVSTSRDHKREQLRVADAATGAIREVLEEKAETFFESGNGAVNWRYLPASNEVIWFSERDNWGHLYLYDLRTGREKHQITTGEGNVTQLLRVDEKNRLLYFLGVGREKGRDPYFRHLYRIGIDGRNLAAADAGGRGPRRDALAIGPLLRRQLFEARRAAGRRAARRRRASWCSTLEKADISRLVAAGWKPPMPITVKARDGVDRSLRPAVQADAASIRRRNIRSSTTSIRVRRPAASAAALFARARRRAGARRAGLHRRRDRRDGHAVAVEEVPRGLLRQHGRQHAARSGDRHEAAGRAVSLDRHRSRRHLRPLGRRLRRRRRDVPLSGFLQGRRFAGRQPRQPRSTRTTGPRSGRGCWRRSRTARPTTTTRRISSSRRT